MAYNPTNWQNGDVITAEKLNNIENGIKNQEIPYDIVYMRLTPIDRPDLVSSDELVLLSSISATEFGSMAYTKKIIPVISYENDAIPYELSVNFDTGIITFSDFMGKIECHYYIEDGEEDSNILIGEYKTNSDDSNVIIVDLIDTGRSQNGVEIYRSNYSHEDLKNYRHLGKTFIGIDQNIEHRQAINCNIDEDTSIFTFIQIYDDVLRLYTIEFNDRTQQWERNFDNDIEYSLTRFYGNDAIT